MAPIFSNIVDIKVTGYIYSASGGSAPVGVTITTTYSV